jgi:hypothetical protein
MSDIKTYYKYDSIENRDIIKRVQECDPIVAEVEVLKDISDGRGQSSIGYHVGRIPGAIIEGYIQLVGITFHEFCVDPVHIKRICNDPQYRQFRIFEGKI